MSKILLESHLKFLLLLEGFWNSYKIAIGSHPKSTKIHFLFKDQRNYDMKNGGNHSSRSLWQQKMSLAFYYLILFQINYCSTKYYGWIKFKKSSNVFTTPLASLFKPRNKTIRSCFQKIYFPSQFYDSGSQQYNRTLNRKAF